MRPIGKDPAGGSPPESASGADDCGSDCSGGHVHGSSHLDRGHVDSDVDDSVWSRSDSLQIRHPKPVPVEFVHGHTHQDQAAQPQPMTISPFRPMPKLEKQPEDARKTTISPSLHLLTGTQPQSNTSPTIHTVPLEHDHCPINMAKIEESRKSSITMTLSSGQLMNSFILGEQLGDGAFGSVWRGKSSLDSQSYAIKLIPFTQELMDVAFREVRTMAKMDGHPFVVRYYTAWIEEMQPFLYDKIKDIAAMQPDEEEMDDVQFMNIPLESDTDSHGMWRAGDDEKESPENSVKLPVISDSTFRGKVKRSCSLTQQERISYEFDTDWGDIDAMHLDQKSKEENKAEGKQQPNEVLIIQMELCDNGTLRDWLQDRKEVDYIQSLHVFKQIVEALHHIHGYNVLHRDLKPQNVFLCKRGGIKLGDFGLSMSSDERTTNNSFRGGRFRGFNDEMTSGLGTPTYAAPEQLQLHQIGGTASYSKPADIYPLGLMAYELLSVFETAMERAIALNELKSTGKTADAFKSRYNRMGYLIDAMVLNEPEDRPTTTDILDLLEVEWTEKTIASPRTEFMKFGTASKSPSLGTLMPTPSNFRRASTHLLTPTATHSHFNSRSSSQEMAMELVAKDEEIAMLRQRISMLEQLRGTESPQEVEGTST